MISRRAVILAVTGAVLVGGAFRLFDLDRRTITHGEFWVPRLDLPDHVLHPPPRHSVSQVLWHSMAGDVHPPGYHLIMLGWNGVFGTSLFGMRLSSALAGALAVLALFLFTRTAMGTSAAVLGSWLLALHGHNVFWSQQLRPWALLSALALFTSYLLLKLNTRWQTKTAAAYALLTAVGLWIDYFFWPLMLGQILWVTANLRAEPRVRTLSLQLGAVLLAFPVFAYLRYHLLVPSHLSGDAVGHIVWLMGFGGLFEYLPLNRLAQFPAAAIVWAAFAAGATLWVIGLRASPTRTEDHQPVVGSTGPGWLLMAAVVSGLIVEFGLSPTIFRARLYVGTLIAPFLLALAAPYLLRQLHRLDRILDPIRAHRRAGPLVTNLAVLIPLTAVLVFTATSVAGKTMFAYYAMMPLTPFILVVVAGGVLAMKKRAAIIATFVIATFLFSNYVWYNDRYGRDYQGVALAMAPLIQEGDVVLVRAEWYSEPIHYYLPPEQYSVLPPPKEPTPDELAAWRTALPDRVWLVEMADESTLEATMDSLSTFLLPDYAVSTRTGAFGGAAWLMVRKTID